LAATIGTLMNCRGITELVVVGIGRQIGVITPQLFTILVLMAVVTTAATGPLLSRLSGGDLRKSPAPPPREPTRPGYPEPRDLNLKLKVRGRVLRGFCCCYGVSP
jgi:hypothetical protein